MQDLDPEFLPDPSGTFTPVDRRRAHDGFLKLDVYDVRQRLFRGGTTPPIRREVLVAHPAVAVICYDPVRDLVVLIEQARLPAALAGFSAIQTEIVAGLIEPGEEPDEVAAREVKEETGLDLIGRPVRIAYALSTPGHSTERVHIYCARVDAGQAGGYFGVADEHEDIRVLTVSIDEFAAWLANGRITHGFALLAGYWLLGKRDALRREWLGRGDGSMTDAVVSTGWLAEHLGDRDLFLVDASFKMPGVAPLASEDYARAHIAGAVFFDIDDVSDPGSSLPHMLPDGARFAAKVGALGIGDEHRIVLYDANGLAGAARVWWSFRAFGHTRVSVLDGGLRKWKQEGRPVTAELPRRTPAVFTARFDPDLVRSRDQILANIATQAEQLLDARAAGRFEGTAPEPWPGRRQGHVPGSRNLDHTLLVDPATGTLKPPAELVRLFTAAGIDLSRPVATSCGSGITASVLALGLHEAGQARAAVYDGSWAEWGLPGDLPVDTGPVAPTARTRL